MIHNSTGRHADFWSFICTVVVSQVWYQQLFRIGDDGWQCSTHLVAGVLTSLRHLQSISVTFAQDSSTAEPCNVAAIIELLQQYTRLTTLNLDLMNIGTLPTAAQDQLNAALDTIARRPQPLRYLALRYPKNAKPPSVDVLRRLCSSVPQLSIPPHALLLTAGGADRSETSAWEAYNVQSFVRRRYVPGKEDLFVSEQAVSTFAAALPSCTHLHLEGVEEGEQALLEQIGGHLTFLQCSIASPRDIRAMAVTCTALTSLCVQLNTWSADIDIDILFNSLQACQSLTELTITIGDYSGSSREGHATVHFSPLPRLRYLHVALMDGRGAQPRQLDAMLTVNITHLVLVLNNQWQLQQSLFDSINRQRLPLLTHCHISSNRAWHESRDEIKERLGTAWCDKEGNVVCWRADKVWQSSVGL